ncbi:MAG: TonB-dependent receptor [Cytophagales bacterium]|nr:TonB-dependent receptor [Cytophagales bacterium]
MTPRLWGQSITFDYINEPLNDILLDLNDRYEVPVSINASLSANCVITVKGTFRSMNKALEMLANECQLDLSKINDVYSFKRKSISHFAKRRSLPSEYLYQGKVVDFDSNEPLPFASVKLGDIGVITDDQGRYTFRSPSKKEYLQIQSLGYEMADTILATGYGQVIQLQQKSFEMEELVITEKSKIPIMNIGEESGHIKFNDIQNSLVPGLTNDLIFNNLRLYPGIMAAGESVADFVIWGSYAGQNHVSYDGISVFNSWGIKADIGRINPYMIKNVEVYKGGYNVPFGDRIGGVVLIDGKSGNLNKAETKISIANQLASAYINVPVFNQSSTLQVAARKSYFRSLDLSADLPDNTDFIKPTYDYGDFNLKFSSTFKNTDKLEISIISSEDDYKGTLISREGRDDAFEEVAISSAQSGSSIKYSKSWDGGGITTLVGAQSTYSPTMTTNFLIERAGPNVGLESNRWTNPIQEYSARLTHSLPGKGIHQVQLGGGFVSNKTELVFNGGNRLLEDPSGQLDRLTFYGYDNIQWTPRFSTQLGLKSDIQTSNKERHIQPRIGGRIDVSKNLNIHFGWGLYNQFISKNSVIGELGNRSDIWQVAADNGTSVLKSQHNVLGVSYISDPLEVSLEGYHKTSSGFSRYHLDRQGITRSLQGEARIIGLDAFVRKRIQSHELWVSYTLAHVEERFQDGRQISSYEQAPQSQKHELKGAVVFSFNRFQMTASSVYGSGFPNSTEEIPTEEIIPYLRTDLAFQYEFEMEVLQIETGLSVLNVFNRSNIRLNQSVNVPDGAIINTVGIPFTPTVYLNFSF